MRCGFGLILLVAASLATAATDAGSAVETNGDGLAETVEPKDGESVDTVSPGVVPADAQTDEPQTLAPIRTGKPIRVNADVNLPQDI